MDALSRKIQQDSEQGDEKNQRKLLPNEVLKIRRELSETIRSFEQSFSLQKQAENILSHVVCSIEAAKNTNIPIPHLSLENVFPNGVYRELIENLPDDEMYEHHQFQPAESLEAESNEIESDYQIFSLDEHSLKRLPAALKEFWTRYTDLFSSNRIVWALFPHFRREISPVANLFIIRGTTVDPCFAIPEIPHNAIVVCIRLSREITPNSGLVFESLGAVIPAHEQDQPSEGSVDTLIVVFSGRNS